jgi:hypothetical protein
MDSKSSASSTSSPSSTAATIQTLLDSSAKMKEAKQQELEQLEQSSKHVVQQSTPDSELQRRARLEQLHEARQMQQQHQLSSNSPTKTTALVVGGIGLASSFQAPRTLSPRISERSSLLKTSSRWAGSSELCCYWTSAKQLSFSHEILVLSVLVVSF